MKGLLLKLKKRKQDNIDEAFEREYEYYKFNALQTVVYITSITLSLILLGTLGINFFSTDNVFITCIIKVIPTICVIPFIYLWKHTNDIKKKLAYTISLFCLDYTDFMVLIFIGLIKGENKVSLTVMSIITCMFFAFIINIFFINITFNVRKETLVLQHFNAIGSILIISTQHNIVDLLFMMTFICVEIVQFNILAKIYDKNLRKSFNIKKQLENSAFHDQLTGIYNRQIIPQITNNEYLPPNQYSIIMIDIDFFKKVNDNFSHQKGDEILKRLADVLKESVRNDDYNIRWGGEEFIIVVKERDLESIISIAYRIKQKFKKANTTDKDKCQPTLSMSCIICDDKLTLSQNVNVADVLLYYVKEHGRNNIAVSDFTDHPKLLEVNY